MYGKSCILIFCNFLLLLLLLLLNDSNSRKNVLYLYLCIIIKKFSGIYGFFCLRIQKLIHIFDLLLFTSYPAVLYAVENFIC